MSFVSAIGTVNEWSIRLEISKELILRMLLLLEVVKRSVICITVDPSPLTVYGLLILTRRSGHQILASHLCGLSWRLVV